MKQIPEFLQNLYNETEKETRPFSRIFAFINLSEAVIKFYTVVTVQNFLETEEDNPSLEEGKAVLGKGLARPSLGLWAFFTERITGLIPKDKFFWENFPEFFEKDLKPATAILVNLRNKYHHGAVPSNEECTKDLSIAEPYLRKILFEGLIGEDRIIIGDVIQGAKAKQVFLERADGRRIELSPLLHSELSPKSKKEELYYFNDAKKWDKGTISTMSYDVGEHVSNKELFNEFRKTFPIPDWEKTKVSRFANRIAELTENFQGRTTELSKIKTFLTESNQGFFFIWGGPGIGKSALIARSLVLVRAGLEEKTQVGETGFDLGTKDIIVLEYFIRRATITEKEDTFYSMLGEDLEGIFKTGISMGNNLQEKKEKWKARLEKIQRKLNGSENIGEDEDFEEEEKPKADSKKKSSEDSFVGKKLILCIDGLDEGEEGILRSIPRGSDLYSNILFVLGGRDVTQTRTLFTTLDAEKKAEIVLHGLSETDIRAIMLKVGNSENLPSEYIAKLLKVSEGNPLYLKMISDSIERGERQAGDLENLPAGVDNLYDGIYERFSKLKDSEILLKILYFFTLAKDFLSVDVVAYFLQLEYFRAEFLLGEIREVLWKDPQRDEVDFLQLFHESLRDYLRKKYDRERFGIQKVILDGLQGWKALCEEGIDPRTARYILQYGVTHLLEEGEQKQAEKFVLDSEFVKYQVEYLNFYTVSLDDAVKVLNAMVEELGGKPGTTQPLEEIFKPKLEGEEFRTTTLVRLVNHAGELGHRAGTDIGIAWTWIEEGRVEEALERLSPIQDKQRLFDCYILALWMLTLQEDGEENRERLGIVLREIEKNIPPEGSKTVKWHEHYSEKFFGEICRILIERELEVKDIFDRGGDSERKVVLLILLGYENVEDKFEPTRLEELRVFIQKYSQKLINLIPNTIKSSESHIRWLIRIGYSLIKFDNIELGSNLYHFALESCRDIVKDGNRRDVLKYLIDSLFKLCISTKRKFLFHLLVEATKEIDSSDWRYITLKKIAESVIQIGDVELGRSLSPILVELASDINNSYDRIFAIDSIGELVSKLRDVDLAQIIFPSLVDLVLSINDSAPRSVAISMIGESVSELGDLDLAFNIYPLLVELISRIDNSYYCNDALSNTAESIRQFKDVELGKRLFDKILVVSRKFTNPRYYSNLVCTIGIYYCDFIDKDKGMILLGESVEVARACKSEQYLLFCNIGNSVYRLGEIEIGKSLLNKSVEICQEIQSPKEKIQALIYIGEKIYQIGFIKIGYSLFKESIEIVQGIETILIKQEALNKIWESVDKLGDVELCQILFERTFEIIRSIDDFYERNEILISIGVSLINLGDFNLSSYIFHEAIELSRGIESWYGLIRIGKSIIKFGDIILCCSLFKEAIEISFVNKSLDALIKICESITDIRDFDLAFSIFPLMIEVSRTIEDSKTKEVILRRIGESLIKLGDVALGNILFIELVNIVHDINDPYCRRDTIIFINKSVCQLGNASLINDIFPKLMNLVSGLDKIDRDYAIIEIGESICKLIDVDCGHSLYPLLMSKASETKDPKSCSHLLSIIWDSVCQIGDLILGRKLFNESVKITQRIKNKSHKKKLFSKIAESIIILGDLSLGRVLFQEEVIRIIEYKAYGSLVNLSVSIGESLYKLGDITLCRIFYPILIDKVIGIEYSTYVIFAVKNICKLVCKLRDLELSLILFPLLLRTAIGIENSPHRGSLLLSIGESVSNLGDLDLSLRLLQELLQVARGIDDSSARCTFLCYIGESVIKMGNMELGHNLFQEAAEVAHGIENSIDRSNSLISIGESVSKLGDVELGRSLFQEAVEVAHCIENSIDRSICLSRLGETVTILGDLDFGNSLYHESVKEVLGIEDIFGDQIETISTILDSVNKSGNVNLSRSIFSVLLKAAREIEDFSDQISMLNCIGYSMSKLGDLELSRSLFQEAIQVANDIESAYWRCISLNEIGKSVIQLGDMDLGRSLFQESADVAHGIEDSYTTSISLCSIGEFVIKLGDLKLGKNLFQEAVEVAHKIEDTENCSEALSKLGKSVSILRESDFSNHILSQIFENGYQLKVSKERRIVIQSIAKTTATFASTTAYTFFETNHESHPDIPDVIKAYTEEYRKIKWEEPKSHALFPYYIRSYRWLPFEGEFDKKGSYDIISTFAKLGKIEEALEAAVGIGVIDKKDLNPEKGDKV